MLDEVYDRAKEPLMGHIMWYGIRFKEIKLKENNIKVCVQPKDMFSKQILKIIKKLYKKMVFSLISGQL